MSKKKILIRSYFAFFLSVLLIMTSFPLTLMNVQAEEESIEKASDHPTVYIASDSTAQTYDPYWKPQAGWGQMLERFFNSDVTIDNHAIGGRSSKTFYTEGRLDAILEDIQPEDYLLIQFGHNDATISRPERYVTVEQYKEYLEIYVESVRQRGATPVLITPVGRRDFNSETGKFNVSFPEYIKGMEEVAADLDVLLVDLSTLSREYYNEVGPEGSRSVFLHADAGVYEAHPNGVQDDTHFQEYGAIQIARMLSEGIRELDTKLADYVTDIEMPEAVPSKPIGVKVSNISNAGAVLTWNAVEGADIYRIYRKHNKDSAYVLVSSSTVPQLNLSGMEDGNVYQVVVTAVNGKGESEQSDAVEVVTKEATLKFDFGIAESPVGEGYTEVNLSTLYTEERGYGIVDNEGMIGRSRDTNEPVLGDWLGYFNVGWDFNVDVPNGLYAAKVYVGDFLGSARTDLTIENQEYGGISAPKEGWTEKVIPQVVVTDGQMNFHFGGSTGIANGLEITPILLVPSGLSLDDQSFEADNLSATISWEDAEGASSYNVYRKSDGSSNVELIGSTTEANYTDKTVVVGSEYKYTVTTIDSIGTETVPSLPLAVSMIDENQQMLLAPKNLQQENINKDDITLSWDTVDDAISYNIYRSESEEGKYVLVGQTKETSFIDITVLTIIPYFYKVAAVNATGISEKSSALEALTDNFAPTTTHEIKPRSVNGLYNSSVQINLIAEDAESGIKKTYHTVNNGEQKIGDSLTLEEEGKYKIQYWSEDNAGNIEEVKSFDILIDITAPKIEFSITDGVIFKVNEEIDVFCSVADNLSGVESIDCEEKAGLGFELGLGAHHFTATAIDAAGNSTSKSIDIEVTVDFDSLASLTELFINQNDSDEQVIGELTAKLVAAKQANERDDFVELNSLLIDYISQVENSVGNSLSEEQANTLIELAKTLASKEGGSGNVNEEIDKEKELEESVINTEDNSSKGNLSDSMDHKDNKGSADENAKKNGKLPKTATSMFNFLLIGLILLATAGGIWIYAHKREVI